MALFSESRWNRHAQASAKLAAHARADFLPLLLAAVVLAVACGGPEQEDGGPQHVGSASASGEYTEISQRFAFFYKPPVNTTMAALANTHDVFVLTRGDEEARDELLQLAVRGPILQYLRFDAIMYPGSCAAKPWDNQVAYKAGDYCRIAKNHPDWFLLDSHGRRIVVDGKYYLMDPGHLGWRQFWLQRAKALQEQFGWCGVFLDNVEASLGKHRAAGRALKKYATNLAWQTAVRGFLKFLYLQYFKTQARPLFGNIVVAPSLGIRLSYAQYLDGAMEEGWAVDWSDGYLSATGWKNHLTLVEELEARGKHAIVVSQGQQGAMSRQGFAYASYLLVMNGNSSFRYASASAYREAWWYPNYGHELGVPLGGRYAEGAVWKRNFARATVIVDPAAHTYEVRASAPDGGTVVPPSAPAPFIRKQP